MVENLGDIQQCAKAIRLLALDVDGVLTDGRLFMGNNGEELKAFNILDGLGIKLLQECGVKVALITSRQSELVKNRAKNLGIEHVFQGRDDKLAALQELSELLEVNYQQIAYMGDDLPDLPVIRRVGLGISVANGHHYVARHARWVTQAGGGEGAVREVCEMIMAAQGKLDQTFDQYL